MRGDHVRHRRGALAAPRRCHHFDTTIEGGEAATVIRRRTDMTASIHATTLGRAIAEIAEGDLAERIRIETAARIVATARRAAVQAPLSAALQSDPAVQAVTEIARHWDAGAVTALEYAETLPAAALERLLRAAPRWAAAFAPRTDRLAA
jgi:hypothetical protein